MTGLLDSELDRIRAELGYNLLSVGAEPYIGVQAIFSQVIQPYMREGAGTTSASSFTAETTGQSKLATLTVASATGITVLGKIAVDVDDHLEMATVRSVSSTTITCYLKKSHAGTYPIAVDGGLVIIRECLGALYNVQEQMLNTRGHGSLKAVDEIEFYDTRGKSQFDVLLSQAEHWRDRLAKHLGIPRIKMGGCGGSVGVY
jgi:hypothetical protein